MHLQLQIDTVSVVCSGIALFRLFYVVLLLMLTISNEYQRIDNQETWQYWMALEIGPFMTWDELPSIFSLAPAVSVDETQRKEIEERRFTNSAYFRI